MASVAAVQMTEAKTAESGMATPPPRLVKAAHEFEAQLMKELMAPLTQSASVPGVGNGAGDEDDQESGSTGALGEFAAEALGQALSAAGGFGIANRILGEIGHAGAHIGNQGGSKG
jgi:Rod binding domain-containing protein